LTDKRRKESGPVPNFLIVGAPKCGTTSVYQYLREHPEAFLPLRKEPNYFCARETIGIGTRDAYLALFRNSTGKKAVGEASVNYLYEPDAPRRIRALLGPETKILIFLRDPVTMIYSLWGTYRREGLEPLDFASALDAVSARMSDPEFARICRGAQSQYDYFARASYSAHVARFLDAFGTNVRVFMYEEFFQPGLPQFAELCRFLNIGDTHRPDGRNYNPAGRPRSRTLYRFMTDWTPWQDPLRALLPRRLRPYIRRVYRRMAVIEAPMPRLPANLTIELRSRFAPDISRLEYLLGRSLAGTWR